MSDAPERIYNWLDSQLSLARFSGVITFNGHHYVVAYGEARQPLVRWDVMKREAKNAMRARKVKRNAAKAAQGGPDMTNWQPIETAPNETPVWVWDGSRIFICERVFMDDAWYWARTQYVPWFDSRSCKWDADDSEVDDDYRPMLWMPLPEPPK